MKRVGTEVLLTYDGISDLPDARENARIQEGDQLMFRGAQFWAVGINASSKDRAIRLVDARGITRKRFIRTLTIGRICIAFFVKVK